MNSETRRFDEPENEIDEAVRDYILSIRDVMSYMFDLDFKVKPLITVSARNGEHRLSGAVMLADPRQYIDASDEEIKNLIESQAEQLSQLARETW